MRKDSWALLHIFNFFASAREILSLFRAIEAYTNRLSSLVVFLIQSFNAVRQKKKLLPVLHEFSTSWSVSSSSTNRLTTSIFIYIISHLFVLTLSLVICHLKGNCSLCRLCSYFFLIHPPAVWIFFILKFTSTSKSRGNRESPCLIPLSTLKKSVCLWLTRTQL